jgi:hypothetical protein
MIPFPTDLTAAQRAQAKLIIQLIFVGIFNGALAALVVFDGNHALSWSTLLIAFLSQAFLAICTVAEKYFSAKGDIPLSTFFELARNEGAARAPVVQMTPTQQALQQSVDSLLIPLPDPEQTAKIAAVSPVAPSVAQA